MNRRPSICPLCEACCGILVDVEGDRPVGVRGDPDDPRSRGHLCPKAAGLVDLHADPDRLRHPIRRTASGWERVGWDEALADIGARIHQIRSERGPDAFALYLGNPNVHNLGMQLIGPMLWRTIRTRNRYSATSVDQLPHQLAASLMFGHQLLLPIPDIDRSDLVVLVGANPLVSNGSLMTAPGMRRRLDALRERGGRLVVVDPRRTETAARADQHVAIRPGTDAAWLLALVHAVFAERETPIGALGRITIGLDALRAAVAPYSPERVAPFTGVDAEVTRAVALALADTPRAFLHGRMGASTQPFGGLAQWLVIALNAITGHLDREGGLMFPEPAVDPIHPPIGRGVGSGGFSRWRTRVNDRPVIAGEPPACELADEVLTPGDGQIRGMLVWAGNPVLSTPNGRRLDEALRTLELLVSVDFYVNETNRHAHYVLPPPAPLARPHYDVVFNLLSTRNYARFADPVVAPDGDVRHDWEIALDLVDAVLRAAGAPLHHRLPGRALRRLGPLAPLEVGLRFGRAKLSLSRLRKNPHGIDLGPLRPSLAQRARRIDLAPVQFRADLPRLDAAMAELRPALVLIGRRELRSNNSWLHNLPRLNKDGDRRCSLLVHPQDAAARGLEDGGSAELRSRVGAVRVRLEVTDDVMPGVVCLPHGWGHDREGSQLGRASRAPGVSVNDVTDERRIDDLVGTAAFSGTPVELTAG